MKVNDAAALFPLPAALTWAQVTKLSSDPATLGAHLTSLIGAKGSIVDAVAVLLSTAPLTAAQRAALFTILSTQPDVTMHAGVTDEVGRTGSALDFPFGPAETMSLLLAADGSLLQVTVVASVDHGRVLGVPRIEGGAPDPATDLTRKGAVLSRQTYLEIGGTNAAPGE